MSNRIVNALCVCCRESSRTYPSLRSLVALPLLALAPSEFGACLVLAAEVDKKFAVNPYKANAVLSVCM